MRSNESGHRAIGATTRAAALLAALPILAAGAAEGSLSLNRMITVSASGTGAANCARLRAAFAAITDASADTPYVVRLEPGLYECDGSASLFTKPHVDLEGAGREVTRIVFETADAAGLTLRPPGELRHVTVSAVNPAGPGGQICALWAGIGEQGESRVTHVDLEASGGQFNCGVAQNSGNSMRLTDVTIEIVDNADGIENYGIAALTAASHLDGVQIRIDGSGGDPARGVGITDAGADNLGDIRSWQLRDTRIEITGHSEAYGLHLGQAMEPVLIEDSWIQVSYGADINRAVRLKGDATIRRSTLIGEGDGGPGIAIYNEGSSGDSFDVVVESGELVGSHNTVRNDTDFDVRIGGSLMSGGPVDSVAGTITCAGVWDESFTFSASTCP